MLNDNFLGEYRENFYYFYQHYFVKNLVLKPIILILKDKIKKFMPEISRFLGIVIRMYFKDHNPPHFHVSYEKYEAIIDIKTLGMIEGNLPPKALSLVVEWASNHKQELLNNWNKTQDLKTPDKIEPLT